MVKSVEEAWCLLERMLGIFLNLRRLVMFLDILSLILVHSILDLVMLPFGVSCIHVWFF